MSFKIVGKYDVPNNFIFGYFFKLDFMCFQVLDLVSLNLPGIKSKHINAYMEERLPSSSAYTSLFRTWRWRTAYHSHLLPRLICLHSLSSVLETLDSKLEELKRIWIAVDSTKLLGKRRELKKTRPDAEWCMFCSR